MTGSIIFVLYWTYALSVVFGLPDSCNTTCTLKPHLPCIIQEYKNSRTADDSLLVWPTKPTEVEVDITYNGSDTKLMVSWGLPDDDAFMAVTGFEIQLEKKEGLNKYSRRWFVFDMSNATWRPQDKNEKLLFNFHCLHGLLGEYTISLTSLPKSRSPDSVTVYITVPNNNTDNFLRRPRTWRTHVAVKPMPWLQKVDVVFGLAPSDYRFVKYKVKIFDEHRIIYAPSRRCSFSKLPFTDGLYAVGVEAVETDRGKETCLCKEISTDKFCLIDFCVTSWSPRFNFIEPTTTLIIAPTSSISTILLTPSTNRTIPTITPDTSPVSTAIAIVLGVTCAVILIFVVLLYLHWKKNKRFTGTEKEDSTPTKAPESRKVGTDGKADILRYPLMQTIRISNECKKRVFLVYYPDNRHHIEVVKTFARYLHNICNCHVRLDLWCQREIDPDKVYWLFNEIEKADKIVVINSEGAFKTFQAFQRRKSGAVSCDIPPSGDLFTPIISSIMQSHYNRDMDGEFRRKSVMVYFEYTPKENLLNYLCTGLTYNLMEQFEPFLLNIYDLEGEGPDKSLHFVDYDENKYWYVSDSFGKALFDSIKAAVSFHTGLDSGFGSSPHYICGAQLQDIKPPDNFGDFDDAVTAKELEKYINKVNFDYERKMKIDFHDGMEYQV